MTFLGIDNRHDLPRVSYSTALDYYVGTCFAFVLASILQFAAVHFFTKRGGGEASSWGSDPSATEVRHGARQSIEVRTRTVSSLSHEARVIGLPTDVQRHERVPKLAVCSVKFFCWEVEREERAVMD